MRPDEMKWQLNHCNLKIKPFDESVNDSASSTEIKYEEIDNEFNNWQMLNWIVHY